MYFNVKERKGGAAKGRGFDKCEKFFDQIPQGGKQKVNQKCQKRGTNLNKQYYKSKLDLIFTRKKLAT